MSSEFTVQYSTSDEIPDDSDARYALFRNETRKGGVVEVYYSPVTLRQVSLRRHNGWGDADRTRAALLTGKYSGAILWSPPSEDRCVVADVSGRGVESKSFIDPLAKVLRGLGLVGDILPAVLLYLAITTRMFEKPVSVVVKGESSSGKSFLVNSVLQLFPESAFHVWTAMSDRTLIYTDREFRHKSLVLVEADGTESRMISYTIRSLLSEGRINYEVVVPLDGGGFTTQRITKEGPTNCVITTTALALHPENETRLISVSTSEEHSLTRDVLQRIADLESEDQPLDIGMWKDLQERLATSSVTVRVPFARSIAEGALVTSPRLRRDFSAFLSLIKAHALVRAGLEDRSLPQCVEATLDDYEAVHSLTAEWFAEGNETSVSAAVRETVDAVRQLERATAGRCGVSLRSIADQLGIHKANASRRVKKAVSIDLLVVDKGSDGRRKSVRTTGLPLPNEQEVFPSRARVEELASQAKRQQ